MIQFDPRSGRVDRKSSPLRVSHSRKDLETLFPRSRSPLLSSPFYKWTPVRTRTPSVRHFLSPFSLHSSSNSSFIFIECPRTPPSPFTFLSSLIFVFFNPNSSLSLSLPLFWMDHGRSETAERAQDMESGFRHCRNHEHSRHLRNLTGIDPSFP